MDYMIVAVVAAAVVIALTTLSDRWGLAPPLILMLVGVGISFLPGVGTFSIPPEWILMGILPPLLYSAAISIPTVELRRDFGPVGGLSILLIVLSAVILGLVIHWLIPGVSLPLGIALGAILSPTDAAATTIVKRLGVPGRVSIILQGESLLNDATALVLLRSAIAATAGTISVWGSIGDFLWAALAASLIGAGVGWLGVKARQQISQPAAATAISFLIPFVAYIPSELVDASGLVGVVSAGITASQLGPRRLDARQRVSERSNWHTIEFLLEGVVFLGMGLELHRLVSDLDAQGESFLTALGVAGLSLLILLVVRGGFLSLLVKASSSNRKVRIGRRLQQIKEAPAGSGEDLAPAASPPLPGMERRALERAAGLFAFLRARADTADPLSDPSLASDNPSEAPDRDLPASPADLRPSPGQQIFLSTAKDRFTKLSSTKRGRRRLAKIQRRVEQYKAKQSDPAFQERRKRRVGQFRKRAKAFFADVEYLMHQPLGAKEGLLLTWAGMRGVVTLAAAQTLSPGIPHRSLLVLVASGSLLLQGGSLPGVIRLLGLAGQDQTGADEWEKLQAALSRAADTCEPAADEAAERLELRKIRAKREALLQLRSTAAFHYQALALAFKQLDADEISLQYHLAGEE